MPNQSGNAYGLTLLCPIINGAIRNESYSEIIRGRLEDLPLGADSPMAKVPNTYLCRFYILNDVFYEGYPAYTERLQSKYLVFSTNFHGSLDTYLQGMWTHAQEAVRSIWEYCVAFKDVKNADDFIAYIKKCQVDNNLFFNGSNDASLADQLKDLYIKQEFSRFVYENHGLSSEELQKRFADFVRVTQPLDLSGPTWQAGSDTAYKDGDYRMAALPKMPEAPEMPDIAQTTLKKMGS